MISFYSLLIMGVFCLGLRLLLLTSVVDFVHLLLFRPLYESQLSSWMCLSVSETLLCLKVRKDP